MNQMHLTTDQLAELIDYASRDLPPFLGPRAT